MAEYAQSKITPFLTMNGQVKEAMEFYQQALPDAKITRCDPYGDQVPWVTGESRNRIMHGSMDIGGTQVIFLDMDADHPAPPFAWSTSLLITCATEAEFDRVFNALKEGGSVMMGPESVGDIKKTAWVVDKFGVTWQPLWQG